MPNHNALINLEAIVNRQFDSRAWGEPVQAGLMSTGDVIAAAEASIESSPAISAGVTLRGIERATREREAGRHASAEATQA
jgi:hypothetical protein